MGRPKKEDKAVKTSISKGQDAAKLAVQESVLQKYDYLFSQIPDRKANLFSTGIPSLDHALGGGLPRGQFVHLYGKQGAGKSTLAQHLAAEALKEQARYCYIDPENTIDKTLASKLGLSITDPRSYIHKYPNAEVVLDAVEEFVKTGIYSIIIFDTIAALASRKILESSNEDDNIGIKSRMMSKACEKLNHAIVQNDCIILFVNQLRANISPMPNAPKTTTPGGETIKFYANINIGMSQLKRIVDPTTDVVIGQEVIVKIEKNKIAAPHKEVILSLIYGDGFRKDYDLINSAINEGIVNQAGSWFKYNGESIGQGMRGMLDYASKQPQWLDELETKLYGNIESEVSGSNSEQDAEVITVHA